MMLAGLTELTEVTVNVRNVNDLRVQRFSAHNGEGEIEMKFAFNPERDPNHSNWNFFGIASFPIGTTAGMHKHEGNDEWFYVISGNATITIDGEHRSIGPGDIILTKDGSEHSITDVVETLVFIAIEVKTS
jgi:mannose-6-phosphate isomerase-like protein (cupin superfamily)